MKPILELFAYSYFTLPIMIVCQISAALVSYHHRKKFIELKYFHLYPIASLIQGIFCLAAVGLLDADTAWTYSRFSVVIFVFLETLLLYNFFLNAIKINSLKIILRALFIAFLLYSLGVFVFANKFLNPEMLITGETFVVILSVCVYFIDLFRLPATRNLIEEPTFWINVGILFVFSCTLPAVVLAFFPDVYLLSNSYYFFINFIGYSVMFLLVIRGYLCRKDEVVSVRRKLGFI